MSLRSDDLSEGLPTASTSNTLMSREKECPRCGKATPAETARCEKCGYEYGSATDHTERYQALLAEEPPAPALLSREVSPRTAGSIIAACLIIVLGTAWAMFPRPVIVARKTPSLPTAPAPINPAPASTAPLSPSPPGPLPGLPAPSVAAPSPAAKDIRVVTYRVTGASGRAHIVYQQANDVLIATSQPQELPWIQTIRARSGADLYLSARSGSAGQDLTVEIDVDGVVRKMATSVGPDGQVVATDTL